VSRCRGPRSGERREALRLLLLARRGAVDVRREALVQLHRVIVTAPDRLREELRGLAVRKAARALRPPAPLRLRRRRQLATRLVLRSLAGRIEAATAEAAEFEREILGHVQALAPQLLEKPGVGPIVAAQLIVAWSHRGRVRSEAAFARLAGVAPVPASSGQTGRHRLSRGGDRQLNRALHTIVLHRRQHDPATRDYIAACQGSRSSSFLDLSEYKESVVWHQRICELSVNVEVFAQKMPEPLERIASIPKFPIVLSIESMAFAKGYALIKL
jgi:transposase